MTKRARRGRYRATAIEAMPMPDMKPRLRLDGEPARSFLDCDPGEQVTVEITGTVRQVGLDKRLEMMPGKKPIRKEKPEVEIEVIRAILMSNQPKLSRHSEGG